MSSLPNDFARQAAAPRLPPSMPRAGTDPGQDGELRRALLTALGILDSGPEAAFDGLTLAAAVATGCPVSALSLADGDRLCFKSLHGPQAEQTLHDGRLLGHGLQQGCLLEVTDVLQDARFDSEGWAPGGPSLRYFAGAPVRLEGLPVGVLCVVDTVPRAPLDAARREALLGLASAAEALLAARRPGAEADARALRRRQDLLSRTSHEMRTPLNAVLGFTQLLQGEAQLLGDARAAAWVQQIANASGHLLALVDELLELARLEAGRRRMAATRLDLAAVLRDCAQMLAPQAAAQGVALTVSGQHLAPDWGVLADERALRQVLINLIGNALQHGPQGHVVTLELQGQGHRRGVVVTDRGPGIAEAELPRLFQPFERLGSRTPGSGLGLAISRQLAESMNGSIDVDSQPGRGSSFTVWLPAAEATALAGP